MDDTETKPAPEEFNVLENLDLLISTLPTPSAVPIQVKKDPDAASPIVEFSPAISDVFSLCHVMKDEPNVPMTVSVCQITNVLSVPDKDLLAADLHESVVDDAVFDVNNETELMSDKEQARCDTGVTTDERLSGTVTISVPVSVPVTVPVSLPITVSLPATCSRLNSSNCQSAATDCLSQTLSQLPTIDCLSQTLSQLPTTDCLSQTLSQLLSAAGLKRPPPQCTEHFACLCTAFQNEISIHTPRASSPEQEKPRFTCSTCKKTFSSNSHLKRHMLLHNRQFNCSECGKEFTSQEKLKKHLALPIICQICKQRFPKPTNLNHHMLTHFPVILNPTVTSSPAPDPVRTADRLLPVRTVDQLPEAVAAQSLAKQQLTCEICGRQFKRKSGLALHVKSHSATRNLKCSQCDKSFRRNYDLKRHIKTHDRQSVNAENVNKPAALVLPSAATHVCKLCGRPFTTARELTEHLELHSGLRPGRCKDCGQKLSFINVHGHHTDSHTHDH